MQKKKGPVSTLLGSIIKAGVNLSEPLKNNNNFYIYKNDGKHPIRPNNHHYQITLKQKYYFYTS